MQSLKKHADSMTNVLKTSYNQLRGKKPKWKPGDTPTFNSTKPWQNLMSHRFEVVSAQVYAGLAHLFHTITVLDKLLSSPALALNPVGMASATTGSARSGAVSPTGTSVAATTSVSAPLVSDVSGTKASTAAVMADLQRITQAIDKETSVDEMRNFNEALCNIEDLAFQHLASDLAFVSQVRSKVLEPMQAFYKENHRIHKHLDRDMQKMLKELAAAKAKFEAFERECAAQLRMQETMYDEAYGTKTAGVGDSPGGATSPPTTKTKQQVQAYKQQQERNFKMVSQYQSDFDSLKALQAAVYEKELPARINQLEAMENFRLTLIQSSVQQFKVMLQQRQAQLQRITDRFVRQLDTLDINDEVNFLLNKWERQHGVPTAPAAVSYGLECKPEDVMAIPSFGERPKLTKPGYVIPSSSAGNGATPDKDEKKRRPSQSALSGKRSSLIGSLSLSLSAFADKFSSGSDKTPSTTPAGTSTSSPPTPVPVAAPSASMGVPTIVEPQMSDICDECEEEKQTVVIHCPDCDEYLCAPCSDRLHSKGKRQLHTFSYVMNGKHSIAEQTWIRPEASTETPPSFHEYREWLKKQAKEKADSIRQQQGGSPTPLGNGGPPGGPATSSVPIKSK